MSRSKFFKLKSELLRQVSLKMNNFDLKKEFLTHLDASSGSFFRVNDDGFHIFA